MARRPVQPEDLLRYVFVGDPQPSPDGDWVLFQRKRIDEKRRYQTSLWLVDLDGNARAFTGEEGGPSQGRWTPDGRAVLFTASRGDGGAQLFRIPADGGEAQPVTKLPEGSVGPFEISPDGRQVAFTFRPAVPGFTKQDEKRRKEDDAPLPPLVINHLWYRLDGDGYFGDERYAIYLVELEGDEPREARKLYDAAAHGDYSFSWHPGGEELAVIHSAEPEPFRQPPNDQVYRVRLDGSAQMMPGLPKGEKENPRWSPDGSLLAYAGDVDESDPWGTRNTKLYVVGPEGGEPRDLTGDTDLDLGVATLSDTAEAAFGAKLLWKPDGSGLLVQVGTKGETQVGFVPVNGGLELLTSGRHAVNVGGAFPDGRVAATVSTPTKLPEVAVVEPELASGRHVPRLLTGFNVAFHDEVEVREPEEHWVETTDGLKVHTWVVRGGEGKRPVAINVHGGPHTQYGWTYFHEFQVFAAAGYTVVYSNPRGSKGYGEAWTAAIKGDWGNKDWDDVQAVTRFAQADPGVHAGRVGIMGGSYGGYMTNWAIGHSENYACAITDRCVSNMVSMAGNSDFPFNKDGYFKGVAWGDLEAIRELWRQSPISRFEGVRTPTLVIHSEGDLRCNVEQGEQVFTALQMEGVPSRFVRYPQTTSHGLSRSGPPELRLHRLNEYLMWMERWLGTS